MQPFAILRWPSKKNLKSISLPLATTPHFIIVNEKKACTVTRKIQAVKWVITEAGSSLNCLPLNSSNCGRRLRPEAQDGSGWCCPRVLRIYEPRGRILKCDSQTFILMWVIRSENFCYYYFLTAENYRSGSKKRIKQTSIPVKIAKCRSSLVHCVFGACQCARLHVQAMFWGAPMCVFIHTSDVFSVLFCFQLPFYF